MEKEVPLLQVVNWDHFENFRSRTFQKCSFVCVPNKHGGMGWLNVMQQRDGAAIYGIWVGILQICSRQQLSEEKTGVPRQGWLTQTGKQKGPRIGAQLIARALHRPVGEVLRALQVLCEEVGWIELIEGTPEWKTDWGKKELLALFEEPDTAVSEQYQNGIEKNGFDGRTAEKRSGFGKNWG